jgi:hypothetical protein
MSLHHRGQRLAGAFSSGILGCIKGGKEVQVPMKVVAEGFDN